MAKDLFTGEDIEDIPQGKDLFAEAGIKYQPENQPTGEPTSPEQNWSDLPSNILPSAGNVVKGIAQAVMHPIDTVNSLSDIAAGAMQKGANALGFTYLNDDPVVQKQKQAVENAVNFYKQRYGGGENIKQTLINDPIGAALDLSTVLAAGGGTLKAAGLPRVGSIASKAGEIANPLTYAAKAIPSAEMVSKGAKSWYERALKPSTTLTDAKKASIISTGLDEAIPVTKGGLAKSRSTISQLNNDIKSRIADYAQQGVTVDRATPVNKLDKMIIDEVANNPLADANISEISKIKDEFITKQPSRIPIQQAQNFKVTLNKELDDFYKAYNQGRIVPPKINQQARRAIADGLREEMSNAIPEIKGLNAREGSLIELNKQLNRAVNRISNRNLLGLTKAVLTGTLGFKGLLMDVILNNPHITTRLAIAMHKASKMKQPVSAATLRNIYEAEQATGNE